MLIDSRVIQYGRIFGDWSIREMIGKGTGGRNAVFKLVREQFGYEEVSAMKVINIIEEKGEYDELSEEYKAAYSNARDELWKKAEEEIRLMYTLKSNVNIVRYLDCNCADWVEKKSFGRDLLIRMDCLDNLRDCMKKHILSEKEVIKIGKDICNALIACHNIKIWHRDIKPDNIFINSEKVYMLGDFGISKMVEESSGVETTAGTKAYAAPEQFLGKYDHRIDIYSLGITLYELANGNMLPFAKSLYVSEAEIQMRLEGNVVPRIKGISDKLNDVIRKACEYFPENRFQSAKEFFDALSSIKESEMSERVEMPANNTKSDDIEFATVKLAQNDGSYETVKTNPIENLTGSYETVKTNPIENLTGSYETVKTAPAESLTGNYETVRTAPAESLSGNYETVRTAPAESLSGNYETVKTSPIESLTGNYETVKTSPIESLTGNYETVKTAPVDDVSKAIEVVGNFENGEMFSKISTETEQEPETNLGFDASTNSNTNKNDKESKSLWYAKKKAGKAQDKVEVKISNIDLEPNTNKKKTAANSLWYGKKRK